MSNPERGFSVRVDVTNPGQFFACCGLLELAHRLWPGAEGRFDQEERAFTIHSPTDASPSLEELLEQLGSCDISGLSEKERRERDTLEAERRRLRQQNQELPKERKHRLQELGTKSRKGSITIGEPFGITLDWWQTDEDDPTAPKTWAGRQEIHKVARSAQEALRAISTPEALFDYGCVMRLPPEYRKNVSDHKKPVEPFYFDARRFVHALDTGFSLDIQDAETVAHPAVELLSLIGLQRFRPKPGSTKWRFEYSVWFGPLCAPVAAAVAGSGVPVPSRQCYTFRFLFRDDQKRYKAFSFATPLGDKS